jgi:hypothetical protein
MQNLVTFLMYQQPTFWGRSQESNPIHNGLKKTQQNNLGINWTKDVKELYNKNCKALKKFLENNL